jgi:hypothetical protein
MTYSNFKVERILFGFLLLSALLMAFVPLVRMHDPNGARVSDAFDLHSGITQLQSELRSAAPIYPSSTGGASVSPGTEAAATPGPLTMPFSIQAASVIPWCVVAALIFAVLALVDLITFQRGVALLSLAGGFFGAIAFVHVLLLSSDVLSWTEKLMSTAELSARGDSALGAHILMVNSFMVTPGLGLYFLATCLLLVPLFSITRAVPRFIAVLRRDPRISVSQKIHIRPINSYYPEETCTSLDISRTGLYLESLSNHYYEGMEVYFTRNDPAGAPAGPAEHAHVVRVEKLISGCRFALHIISNP